MQTEKLEKFYNKNYKKLLVIPFIILALSLLVLFYNYKSTGFFIDRDVSLQGGITANINTNQNIDIDELKSFLENKFPKSDIVIRKISEFTTGKATGIIIEASNIKDSDIRPALSDKLNIELTEKNYSIEEISSGLGESFFKDFIIAILFAFLFMAIVVFIAFRTLIPSLAIILSPIFDLTITLAIISLLDFKLSTAGLAAFLLIIGYSIDTDILLTTRVLKRREESLFNRMFSSMKTGLTMTATTIVSVGVGFIATNSSVLKQIFAIILIALLIDIMSTYFVNMALLKIYVKRKYNEN